MTVAWGGKASTVNAHVTAPDQRWGYDLIVTIDGKSFRGSGRELADLVEVVAQADTSPREALDHPRRQLVGPGVGAAGQPQQIRRAPSERNGRGP